APSFVFFQAEDGIRDRNVTGVQTCALPIFNPEAEKMLSLSPENIGMSLHDINPRLEEVLLKIRTKGHFRFRDSPHRYYRGLINQIGRASCRERVELAEGAGPTRRQEHHG